MSEFRVVAASLLLCASLIRPEAAVAQAMATRVVAEIGGWTIVAASVDGAHMRCVARAPGSGAAPVTLEKSSEGWTVVVPSAAPGDEVKGTVDIDGKSSSGAFYRMDDGRVGTFLDPARMKRIGAGKRMTVRVAGVATPVALDGVAAVLKRTAACDAAGGK